MNTNVIYMTKSTAKPDKVEQVHQAMVDVAAAARMAPGCVDYRIFKASDDSTVNFEIWENDDARNAFNSSPAVEKFIAVVGGNFAVSPDPIAYKQMDSQRASI